MDASQIKLNFFTGRWTTFLILVTKSILWFFFKKKLKLYIKNLDIKASLAFFENLRIELNLKCLSNLWKWNNPHHNIQKNYKFNINVV